MLIDYKDSLFENLFHNALDCKRTEYGILPLRFTDNQLSLYSMNEHFRVRSLCASGAYIDLLTDSGKIKICFEIKEMARDFGFFDLYIDGLFTGSKGSETASEIGSSVSFDLKNPNRKMQRISIYLPHLVVIYIKELEIDDGCSAEKVPVISQTILCMGDSITQGMTAMRPSSPFTVQLSQKLKMRLLNQGVGGYIFNADSIDNLHVDPQIVIVAYGINDLYQYSSKEVFEKNCAGFMDKLETSYLTSKKVIITPIWKENPDEVHKIGTLYGMRDMISSICSRYKDFLLIDGLELVPNESRYFVDGIHPNDEGFNHYAINLLGKI